MAQYLRGPVFDFQASKHYDNEQLQSFDDPACDGLALAA